MCLMNGEVFAQKFGYQRAEFYSGVTNQEKSLNQFDRAVYYPTNWRGSYDPQRAKYPEFIRYGGMVSVAPQYFQRNYQGILPIAQQPIVDDPKPYTVNRLS